MFTRSLLLAAFVLGAVSVACADLAEQEPNDTFPGSHIGTLNNGENVTGSMTSSDDDFHYFDTAANGSWALRRYVFDVNVSPSNGDSYLYIYDTSPSGWFLGNNDDVNYPADATSWVSFDLFDSGGTNTWGYYMWGYNTFDYWLNVSWYTITPTFAGSFQPGALNINTLAATFDTELSFFDGFGNFMAANDDFGGLQSNLDLVLSPGLYYLCLGGYNTRDPGDAISGGGSWDRSGAGGGIDTRGGDYGLNVGGTLINGTLAMGDRHWFTIEVVPEPSTYAALATGLLGLLAIRRRK